MITGRKYEALGMPVQFCTSGVSAFASKATACGHFLLNARHMATVALQVRGQGRSLAKQPAGSASLAFRADAPERPGLDAPDQHRHGLGLGAWKRGERCGGLH